MSRDPEIALIESSIPPSRQRWARHYGVHPYFTRRPANVVLAYIERYSDVGDIVLDPFGGSGVTVIEAFLSGRKAIQNDINPLANFITANIADTTLPSLATVVDGFDRVRSACQSRLARLESADDAEVDGLLRDTPLPENIPLPRTADVERYHELFTPRQLAGLALLKQAIDREADGRVRGLLLLAWSATLAKTNRTFLSAKGRAESRGGSSIFSIYRYKVAASPVEIPVWETFEKRFENVLAAKREVLQVRDYYEQIRDGRLRLDSSRDLQILAKDAAALGAELGPNSVGYIFTDPPYGGHIAYLDLSVLWNHWLGFTVDAATQEAEAIVGGERRHTKEDYTRKLGESIGMCVRVLKPGRWLSVVFQHWELGYFAAILEGAESAGATLRAAVVQEPGVVWSMHKKKNSKSVLSGEMILTFQKAARERVTRPKRSPHAAETSGFEGILDGVLEGLLPSHVAVSTEVIFNEFVLAAWESRRLDSLSVSRDDLAGHLQSRGWSYDKRAHRWAHGAPKQEHLFTGRGGG